MRLITVTTWALLVCSSGRKVPSGKPWTQPRTAALLM
jgi:hypothetical protein